MKVSSYLARHYHENADLAQAAAGIRLSEDDLDALFRRFKGKSAADVLLQYKLNGLCNRLGVDLERPVDELMWSVVSARALIPTLHLSRPLESAFMSFGGNTAPFREEALLRASC